MTDATQELWFSDSWFEDDSILVAGKVIKMHHILPCRGRGTGTAKTSKEYFKQVLEEFGATVYDAGVTEAHVKQTSEFNRGFEFGKQQKFEEVYTEAFGRGFEKGVDFVIENTV